MIYHKIDPNRHIFPPPTVGRDKTVNSGRFIGRSRCYGPGIRI